MYVSMLMMHADINNNINSIMLHADMIFFLVFGRQKYVYMPTQHSVDLCSRIRVLKARLFLEFEISWKWNLSSYKVRY